MYCVCLYVTETAEIVASENVYEFYCCHLCHGCEHFSDFRLLLLVFCWYFVVVVAIFAVWYCLFVVTISTSQFFCLLLLGMFIFFLFSLHTVDFGTVFLLRFNASNSINFQSNAMLFYANVLAFRCGCVCMLNGKFRNFYQNGTRQKNYTDFSVILFFHLMPISTHLMLYERQRTLSFYRLS